MWPETGIIFELPFLHLMWNSRYTDNIYSSLLQQYLKRYNVLPRFCFFFFCSLSSLNNLFLFIYFKVTYNQSGTFFIFLKYNYNSTYYDFLFSGFAIISVVSKLTNILCLALIYKGRFSVVFYFDPAGSISASCSFEWNIWDNFRLLRGSPSCQLVE